MERSGLPSVLGAVMLGLCLVDVPAAPPAPTPATASQPATQAATAPAELTVMTYNILYANRDLNETAAVIRDGRADVVALQETNRASAAALRRELGRLYPSMRFHEAPGAGGLALLAKQPLKDIRVLPPTHGPFATLVATVAVNGRDVTIANVHLTPTAPPTRLTPEDLVGTFNGAEQLRAQEITDILKRLPGATPTVILGDLNGPPGSIAPARLIESGYIDSFAAPAEQGENGPAEPDDRSTWRGGWADQEVGLRVDYVFHSRHLTTAASRVVAEQASDHDAVVATLRLGPPSVSIGPHRAEAMHVAYVIDGRAELAESWPTVRRDLLDSIDRIETSQSLDVLIARPDKPVTLTGDRPTAPTDALRARLRRYLETFTPAGETDLPQAVALAAERLRTAERPRVIVLITPAPPPQPQREALEQTAKQAGAKLLLAADIQ